MLDIKKIKEELFNRIDSLSKQEIRTALGMGESTYVEEEDRLSPEDLFYLTGELDYDFDTYPTFDSEFTQKVEGEIVYTNLDEFSIEMNLNQIKKITIDITQEGECSHEISLYTFDDAA